MQGYIILACDHDKYREMAVNLAYSLRVLDPQRPVSLIYQNISVTDECQAIFHKILQLKNQNGFVKNMNKIRLYEISPYDQTMFLDADMLLMRPNISAYWE